MLFNIVLFASLLLASIARATPSIFHRDASVSHDGGVFVHPGKLVLSVIGTIVVPTTLVGNEGDQVYFSTGVDGFDTGCTSSSFQLGIVGIIDGTDQTSYSAVYHDPNFGDDGWLLVTSDVSPGDHIMMAVAINPNDMTSGYGTISNLNTTNVYDIYFSTGGSSSPLCSHTGGWFIQIRGNVDFGTEFQYAAVNTVDDGTYYPSDPNFAEIVNISEGNEVLYDFETNGNTITVQHL